MDSEWNAGANESPLEEQFTIEVNTLAYSGAQSRVFNGIIQILQLWELNGCNVNTLVQPCDSTGQELRLILYNNFFVLLLLFLS